MDHYRDGQGRPRRHWSPNWVIAAVGAITSALGPPAAIALAHLETPPTPQDFWRTWHPEPASVLPVVLVAWLYARGMRTLWRRVGPRQVVRGWQVAAFAAGLLALLVALASPLDALAAALFSAHMLQHLLLIVVAAPLLALGAPLVPLLWALPPHPRHAVAAVWRQAPALRAGWRALSRPALAWALQALALWLWHLPPLYEAALASEPVHAAEHVSFLGTALLFWWPLVRPGPTNRLGGGMGTLYVFTAAVQGSALGALLTFAPAPWYGAYDAPTRAWGLTPLEDQQLAGLLMWIPSSLVYLLAASVVFPVGLAASERALRQREYDARGTSRTCSSATGACSQPRARPTPR
jgi:putative membrane protein